jgi:3-oxoadipate enol-lactonase
MATPSSQCQRGAPHRNGLSSSRVNSSAEPRLAPRAAQLMCWMLPGHGLPPLQWLQQHRTPSRGAGGGLEPPSTAALVGASLGGRVVLEVAVARPQVVDALVLADAALPGFAWSDQVRASWTEEDAALEHGDLHAAVEANLRLWVDGPRRPPTMVDSTVREHVRQMQRRAFELQVPVWEDAEEELLVSDLAMRLSEVRAPTLVVVGEEDVSDFHQIAVELSREIPGAQHAVIPNAAHLPSLERPAAFNELALRFLARDTLW